MGTDGGAAALTVWITQNAQYLLSMQQSFSQVRLFKSTHVICVYIAISENTKTINFFLHFRSAVDGSEAPLATCQLNNSCPIEPQVATKIDVSVKCNHIQLSYFVFYR